MLRAFMAAFHSRCRSQNNGFLLGCAVCSLQVLESTPLLGEDLVGQLEATAALWRAFASHWRLLQDCRYPAARCQASRYKVSARHELSAYVPV